MSELQETADKIIVEYFETYMNTLSVEEDSKTILAEFKSCWLKTPSPELLRVAMYQIVLKAHPFSIRFSFSEPALLVADYQRMLDAKGHN